METAMNYLPREEEREGLKKRGLITFSWKKKGGGGGGRN